MDIRNRSTRPDRLIRAVLLSVGVLLSTACGGDTPLASPIDESPSDEPLPDEVRQSADDCEITAEDDTCDDTPRQDEGTDPPPTDPDVLADAARLIGMAEDRLPAEVRIARRGDEAFPVTEDYVIGRRTVELDRNASGTYVVTSLVLEAEGGPVRMPPGAGS